LLESLKEELRTLVFYETAGRLLQSLADLQELLGNRAITIAREMTKIYEEVFFGSISQAREHFSLKPPKGELVLIVEKPVEVLVPLTSFDEQELRSKLDEMMCLESLSRSVAIKQLSERLKTSRRELYQLLIPDKRT